MGSCVAYYRVSTEGQGRSGLGLEGQEAAVGAYVQVGGHTLVASYTEVESGKRNDRPELARALRHCRKSKATLVVAKLDRLSRNVAFLANMMDSGVEFVACDNPHASRFTLHILAAVAEHEAKAISERTKAALAAYKARGGTLGGSRPNCAPVPREAALRGSRAANADRRSEAIDHDSETIGIVMDARSEGLSLSAIADRLNAAGFTTSSGVAFGKVQVQRIIRRNGE